MRTRNRTRGRTDTARGDAKRRPRPSRIRLSCRASAALDSDGRHHDSRALRPHHRTQRPGRQKIAQKCGIPPQNDGETRTRTGDTTIFSQYVAAVAHRGIPGKHAVLAPSALYVEVRKLRAFPLVSGDREWLIPFLPCGLADHGDTFASPPLARPSGTPASGRKRLSHQAVFWKIPRSSGHSDLSFELGALSPPKR
jgi:hypothetical protein